MFMGEHWPTRDKVIPFTLFRLLNRQIPRLDALERLDEVEAARLARALHHNPKHMGTKAAYRRLKRMAGM